jgi:tRNA(adenine34) deaminase
MTVMAETKADSSRLDVEMMRRCIRLSAQAAEEGEFPFASIVCEGARVVTEVTNRVAREADVTRHAELIAVSEAQRVLSRKDLSSCTLYSNIEPCVMCSFPIRETCIQRVIFAISSPYMGGFSKWNVLRDSDLAKIMPEAFGATPEVRAGLLADEAEAVWKKWNPLIWAVIKHRGCFQTSAEHEAHLPAGASPRGFMRRLFTLGIHRHSL